MVAPCAAQPASLNLHAEGEEAPPPTSPTGHLKPRCQYSFPDLDRACTLKISSWSSQRERQKGKAHVPVTQEPGDRNGDGKPNAIRRWVIWEGFGWMNRSASGTEIGMARSVAVFSLDSGKLTHYIYVYIPSQSEGYLPRLPSGLTAQGSSPLPRRSLPLLPWVMRTS